jgi:hypothetical protein
MINASEVTSFRMTFFALRHKLFFHGFVCFRRVLRKKCTLCSLRQRLDFLNFHLQSLLQTFSIFTSLLFEQTLRKNSKVLHTTFKRMFMHCALFSFLLFCLLIGTCAKYWRQFCSF